VPKQIITTEIEAPASQVWQALTVPKEIEFWAPNVRNLRTEPDGVIALNMWRFFHLDLGGKDLTLETEVTHCIVNELFAESIQGGTAGIHDKVEHLKVIFRLIELAEKRCALNFTIDYEMKGFMNKMLEKVIMGALLSQYKLWFERLKTYAETGRPV